MIVHKHLPEGAFKCRWEVEYYVLKPRKKRCYPYNIIIRLGYRHLVWSRYAGVFYERIINKDTLDENLLYYTKAGWLFLWPDDDTLKEIREEMQHNNLSYRELMWRRKNELAYYRKHNSPPTGNADQFWEKYHKEQFHKYLKK